MSLKVAESEGKHLPILALGNNLVVRGKHIMDHMIKLPYHHQ